MLLKTVHYYMTKRKKTDAIENGTLLYDKETV